MNRDAAKHGDASLIFEKNEGGVPVFADRVNRNVAKHGDASLYIHNVVINEFEIRKFLEMK